MACTCGEIHRLSESGDQRARAELNREIASTRDPTERSLLRIQRDQINGEIATTKTFDRGIKSTGRAVVDQLKTISQSRPLSNLPRSAVRDLIRNSGLDQAMFDTIDSGVSRLLPSVYDGIALNVDDLLRFNAIDFTDTQTVVASTIGTLFEDTVLPSFEQTINRQLANATIVDDDTQIIDDIALQLTQHQRNLTTEARTQTSAMSRMATQVGAALAGLEYQLYSGVVDGLTRPFCSEIVGIAFTNKQIGELNNDQGLPVALYGGGYNCRHGWSPVSEGMLERLGKPRATSTIIKNANAAAKRS